jgi:hypothetical protein
MGYWAFKYFNNYGIKVTVEQQMQAFINGPWYIHSLVTISAIFVAYFFVRYVCRMSSIKAAVLFCIIAILVFLTIILLPIKFVFDYYIYFSWVTIFVNDIGMLLTTFAAMEVTKGKALKIISLGFVPVLGLKIDIQVQIAIDAMLMMGNNFFIITMLTITILLTTILYICLPDAEPEKAI